MGPPKDPIIQPRRYRAQLPPSYHFTRTVTAIVTKSLSILSYIISSFFAHQTTWSGKRALAIPIIATSDQKSEKNRSHGRGLGKFGIIKTDIIKCDGDLVHAIASMTGMSGSCIVDHVPHYVEWVYAWLLRTF